MNQPLQKPHHSSFEKKYLCKVYNSQYFNICSHKSLTGLLVIQSSQLEDKRFSDKCPLHPGTLPGINIIYNYSAGH